MTHLLSVVGPGDPAAHKTSLLTVASFRTWRGSQDSVAQGPAPSRVRKSKSSNVVKSGSTDRRQRRDDFPTGSSWPASRSFSEGRRRGWAFVLALRCCTRSRQGAKPPRAFASLGHPMKGAHPLQNPRSNPTLLHRLLRVNQLRGMRVRPLHVVAERVGFEPTVPLPAHVLSRHAESSTLAPLRGNVSKRWHLSMGP